jgi:hypothetical protein
VALVGGFSEAFAPKFTLSLPLHPPRASSSLTGSGIGSELSASARCHVLDAVGVVESLTLAGPGD